MSTTNSTEVGAPARAEAIVTGSTTLLEILDSLKRAGYPAQLVARTGGIVRCSSCGAETGATEVKPDGYRRIEGASDAADMNIVVWAACTACGTGAALLLGYGPNASEADESVLGQLRLSAPDTPGVVPGEADED